MKQPAVTIGIPVYNEGENIKRLIGSILNQKDVKISKVIISSDGSTDNTSKVVKSLKNKKVLFIDNPTREGIARGLNQVASKAVTGILVTMDADIRISDKYFVKKLITPILMGNADLTASAIKAIKPKNLIDSALNASMELKEVLFSSFKGGQNIYTCYGLARAFSRKLYKKIKFPVSAGNDMYSYLYCINKKMKFKHTPEAIAYYKLPQNLTDHINQSARFSNALNLQKKYFNKSLINKETGLTPKVYFNTGLKSLSLLSKHSALLMVYFAIQLYSKLLKNLSVSQTWTISQSTKNL